MVYLFKYNDKGMLRQVDPNNHKDEPKKHMVLGIDILLTDEEIKQLQEQSKIAEQQTAEQLKQQEELQAAQKSATDKLLKLGLTQEEVDALRGV